MHGILTEGSTVPRIRVPRRWGLTNMQRLCGFSQSTTELAVTKVEVWFLWHNAVQMEGAMVRGSGTAEEFGVTPNCSLDSSPSTAALDQDVLHHPARS